jgi:two-component system, sensor histidine kinase
MPTASLILNVDDDDAARYVKSRILKLAGFQVLEAGTGAGALDIVRERAPGLVLLDVKLPDINGRDVCGMIKRDPGMSGVVVLLTSATHIDMRHRVLALDAGADGYLVAPMEPEELVANVRALLRMRKAERERQAAMEALQEADRRKDQFLAMLAHELRNPLAPIRNAVEIMRRSEDRQTHARAREVIGRQAEHLARLVDDLLEMSRITQGKVVLQRKPVTLASLVEAAVEVARPFVDKSAQQLEVHLPAAPIWLEVDPVRMSQVIGNVLHNASKFTPAGGRIALAAHHDADGVEIAITDDGMGIPKELLSSVFDLFSQADRSLDRAQGGLGIGLSVVKRLVEMHGGSVAVASLGPGQGSRFEVRLPSAVPVAGRPRDDHSLDATASPGDGSHLLIADDNRDSADSMAMMLGLLGYRTTVVYDGDEALQAAAALRPRVAILDIGMPRVSGHEVARRLRSEPWAQGMKLIALSGWGRDDDRRKTADAGFDHHLVKPLDLHELAALLAPVGGPKAAQ